MKHAAKYTFDSIVAVDPAAVELKKFARKVALKDINVLIEGESGTGKELYAQSIHNASERRYHPFFPVNCATLDSQLLESELFGYEDASFTGAKKGGKRGIFEEADGGTVFLDEIGEMDLRLQAKLLRTLQENTIRAVGSTTEKEVNIRVIAATNRDLKEMVEQKKFRLDLYYRLAEITFEIPPLRSRREDIGALVDAFLEEEVRACKRRLQMSESARDLLLSYDFPGNVRELHNAVKVAALMAEDAVIQPEDLPKPIYSSGVMNHIVKAKTISQVVADTEVAEIQKALLHYGSDTQGKRLAAKELGISLATLYNKLRAIKASAG